jgi:hypothetical protein
MKRELLFFAGFSIGALMIGALIVSTKPIEEVEVVAPVGVEIEAEELTYQYKSDEFGFTFDYPKSLIRDGNYFWEPDRYAVYQQLINAEPEGPVLIFQNYEFLEANKSVDQTLEAYAVGRHSFSGATSFEEAEEVEVIIHQQGWSHEEKIIGDYEVVWITFPMERFGPMTYFYVYNGDVVITFREYSEGPEFPVMEAMIASLKFEK